MSATLNPPTPEPAGTLSARVLRDSLDFSLVLGGPLFQLLRRAHMSGAGLELVYRRILGAVMVLWLPLLILSTLEGSAFSSAERVAFLRDIEIQVRFLVALPLMILAEIFVHQRLRVVARQFLDQGLIPTRALSQFDEAILSAMRVRNSPIVEIVLLISVYTIGTLVWRYYLTLDTATWYAEPGASGPALSAAGAWYGYVSLPIFQFILLRWYFRVFIWMRFLWHVSRLPLNLLAIHADRAGGLGFLTNTINAFVPLLVAQSALLAGVIANRIFYADAALLDFIPEIAVLLVFLTILVLVPLLVFTPRLLQTRRVAVREYGVLAQRYAREFDTKWLRGGAPSNESLLGTSDIQSLADLGNSFDIIYGMRATPLTKDAILRVAVAAVVPLLPLTLTMIPLDELLKRLVKIIL